MVGFFCKMAIAATTLLAKSDAVAPKAGAPTMDAAALTSSLRGKVNATAVKIHHVLPAVGSASKAQMPCQCVASNPAWQACARTVPRCVFIDLGAADGNSFNHFMNNGYGDVGGCPSGQWSSVLVEANPRFNSQLAAIGAQHVGQLTVMSSTAAYMCEAQTSFFLDTVNTEKNFWGSSMSNSHPDVKRSGQQKVTVPTMNLNRILYEQTIPGDWVMVKMDIEGSEYDVLPCVAQSPAASLVDRLYLEQHDASWGMAGTTPAQMEAAKNELRHKGVDIPDYFSYTL
jgi:FkbM family methyltransferase